MKAFLDESEYYMIESALIQLGRLELDEDERKNLTRTMQKLRAVHDVAKNGKIILEPGR